MSEEVATASTEASAHAGQPVFGLADCLARLDGNADLLEKLVGIYLKALPGHMDRLKHALAGGDLPSAGRVAHLLCGASANVGACRVAALAKRWDAALRAGLAGPYDVALLEAALADFVDALRERWPTLSVPAA